ncbi:PREDICTED: serine--tRNA ligase, mitochondrial [Bactrocera latifrons]|uniref:serine--tRNA ligase n=2 Tax=Bactrocera latifrons TaxID=174628 RepID=A0A0K8U1P4_BACLA|nr:PREDICTED: serine--tRNA ligase, mitochondrial [Bactrocera latifrons]
MAGTKIFINKFSRPLVSEIFRNYETMCDISNHIKLFSTHNVNEIFLRDTENNILLRKHTNNVPVIKTLLQKLGKCPNDIEIQRQIEIELLKLPNSTHSRVVNYGEKGHEVYNNNLAPGTGEQFSDVCKYLNVLRMEHLGQFAGHKSYYLMGDLASLEQSLVRYTMSYLRKEEFKLISVPDILPSNIINGCGMQTEGNRNQIYKIDSEECLSGTSEMALAGFFTDQVIEEQCLPLKIAAVSRCYRAETSGLNEEKGIYRVHQFTKVEMFAVCSEKQSEMVLESFKDTEMCLYKQLNLKFRVLDMPPNELGASAFQKYDIEAWLPGRQMWGEISSCSNCTDYQAKRLNIKYKTKDGILKYTHTVNGTAAAIPRLLIALIESNKIENGTVYLPEELRNILNNSLLTRNKVVPSLKLIKHF